MLRKGLAIVFGVGAFTCAVFAQSHPNFSGTWKLNSTKSQPGDYGPSARTDVITQDGSKFTDKVTSSTQMGDSNYTLSFTADGTKATVAPDSPESNMGALTLKEITAAWDGQNVALTMASSFQGQMDIESQSAYSLSADGKSLTITDHVETAMGNFDTSLVFDKQ